MRGPETIYAWRYAGSHHEGQWNRSKLSHTEAEYIRADIADARVAAAYEAAANIVERAGHSLHVEIRALTPNDAKAALEAVRREARAEALLEAYNALFVVSAASTEQEHMAQRCQFAVHSLIDKETTE